MSNNLGVMALLGLFLYSLAIFRGKVPVKNSLLMVYALYNFLIYLFTSLSTEMIGIGVIAYNIAIIFLIVVILGNWERFDAQRLFEYVQIISLLATLMLFLQYIVHIAFGSFFTLFPMSVYTETISQDINFQRLITTGVVLGWFRPSAFFVEPAHFSQYVSVALAITMCMYFKDENKKWLILQALYTLSILMTSSGIGFICVGILWTVFILKYTVKKKSKGQLGGYIFGMILIWIFVIYMSQQEYIHLILLRLTASSSSGMSAIHGRSGGYIQFASQSSLQKIFGVGMGKEPSIGDEYYTSGSILLIRSGIVGVGIYALAVIQRLRSSSDMNFWILIAVIIVIITAGVYDFTNVAFYMMLVFANTEKVNSFDYVKKFAQ